MQFDPSLLVTAGFLTTLVLAMKRARNENLDQVTMFWFGAWGVAGALVGGHLLHALSHPKELAADPMLLFRVMEGGKAVFGAFWGAVFLGWLYLLRRREPFLPYADAAVPAIALGYGIVRVGCFLNGDDFGTVSTVPWAVRFPPGTDAFFNHLEKGWITANSTASLPVHPTQLYHVAAGLLLFAVLRHWQGAWAGNRLALALVGYGLLRFVLEFYRGDATPLAGPFDSSQIFCLGFLSAAGLLWWRRGRRAERSAAMGSTSIQATDPKLYSKQT
jgi:phosphatidylglycerol:prolipoprotein diacylglycerol transferase